uniref:DNA polymerase eta n=1 Tax=Daphnia galeata TaxID=27404 RepID=A0A8J2RV35_9CRUS|nr:unnamed protein product [Daphnia galeata]
MSEEEKKRVVALIDMDCFYVQVEERENPGNKGKPACVVQYKKWKGGGIISVNYEARAQGVTRQMRGDEAREKCPDCILYRVPEQRGKADLTRYRDGGKEVIDVMCSFGVCVERASIDEAYIDMTLVVDKMFSDSRATDVDTEVNVEELPNTHFVGWGNETNDVKGVCGWLQALSQGDCNENDWKLTFGAILVERIRAAVYEKTGFRCSAGIANNKMLAKLACGINKPNKQTVLPFRNVQEFFSTFPLKKVRNLGGKLGLALREEFNCTTMADIVQIPERVLQDRFDSKTGTWLYWYARGVDNESVSSRTLPKSIGCNKNFTGLAALDSREKISHWLEELCAEVSERLEKDRETNNRTAKLLTLTVRLEGDIRPYSYTRSIPLTSSYEKVRMANACLAVMGKENPCIKQANTRIPVVVTCLGVSAGKFVDQLENHSRIDRFFVTKQSALTGKGKESCATGQGSMHEINEINENDTDQEVEENELVETELEETKGISEIEEENTTEPERNTANSAPECPEPVSVNREISLPSLNQENRGIANKSGFFASRSLKKSTPIQMPIKEFTSEPVPEIVASQESFSIEELFPDLNEVDMETLALLPLHLQRQVLQAIEARKGSDETDKLVVCDKCKKQLLREEIEEHKDFHLASELQKEFSVQPSASGSLSVNMKGQAVAKKSSKRPLKNQKNIAKETKRSRTIDSFFGNQS